ncbi:MAG: hypothetical protein Q8N44_05070 [Rubrivivax sp.]|nr:hypothetical protein [Rubrivivax sp.]
MERVSNKHDEDFPAATLYMDDVVQVLDTFAKACESVEVTASEYKITDPNELPALAAKFPQERFDDLKIQGFKPYVSLELRSYGARTYISEDTIEQRVVVTSAREVLVRCRKFKPDSIANVAYLLLAVTSVWAVMAKAHFVFFALVLAAVALLPFSVRLRMKNTVIVYTKNRSEAKGFLQRKKDDLLLVVLSAALGAAASYAATKLLP